MAPRFNIDRFKPGTLLDITVTNEGEYSTELVATVHTPEGNTYVDVAIDRAADLIRAMHHEGTVTFEYRSGRRIDVLLQGRLWRVEHTCKAGSVYRVHEHDTKHEAVHAAVLSFITN
jgi:hypothetical protein